MKKWLTYMELLFSTKPSWKTYIEWWKKMHCLVLNEVGREGGVKGQDTSVFQLCDLLKPHLN